MAVAELGVVRRFYASCVNEDTTNPQQSDAHRDYQRGSELCRAGQFAEAVPFLRRSAMLQPHFKTFELLGECFLRLGSAAEAVPFLAAATSLNRGIRAPALLAEAFLLLDATDDARQFADLVLARDPNNRQAKDVLSKLRTGNA